MASLAVGRLVLLKHQSRRSQMASLASHSLEVGRLGFPTLRILRRMAPAPLQGPRAFWAESSSDCHQAGVRRVSLAPKRGMHPAESVGSSWTRPVQIVAIPWVLKAGPYLRLVQLPIP